MGLFKLLILEKRFYSTTVAGVRPIATCGAPSVVLRPIDTRGAPTVVWRCLV